MSTETKTTRFAPYIESQHRSFLENIDTEILAVYHNSPYGQNMNIVDDLFFGTGFFLSNQQALFDKFGLHMERLDISELYNRLFVQFLNVDEIVENEYNLLYSFIMEDIIPKFQQGVRDINASFMGSYLIGEGIIQDACDKSIEKFRTTLRFNLLIAIMKYWKSCLKWNADMVSIYMEILQLYIKTRMGEEEYNQEIRRRDSLWPFTILEYQRSALSILQSSTTSSPAGGSGSRKEPSQLTKSLSGMVGWAMMGAQIGGPWGAVIGAVIGLALSFL